MNYNTGQSSAESAQFDQVNAIKCSDPLLISAAEIIKNTLKNGAGRFETE